MSEDSKTIYVGLDIDGTVISHCYPYMNGRDLGAIPWLKKISDEFDVAFLLNTMRSDASLTLAVTWLEERCIAVEGSGTHPNQAEWTNSPKCHCHVYIEDRACGTPLNADMSINWDLYGPMVVETVRLWHRLYSADPHATAAQDDPQDDPQENLTIHGTLSDFIAAFESAPVTRWASWDEHPGVLHRYHIIFTTTDTNMSHAIALPQLRAGMAELRQTNPQIALALTTPAGRQILFNNWALHNKDTATQDE